MANLLGQALGTIITIVTREATVSAVDDPEPGFRLFRIELPRPSWTPGEKVQFAVTPTAMRTLTPFDWNDEGASFLVYLAGHGPMTPWAQELRAGAVVRLVGPRRSLSLDLPQAPILVGDETSLALAAAWQRHGQAPALAQVYEATAPEHTAAAAQALSLGDVELIQRTPDDGHHEAMVQRVLDLHHHTPDAPLVLTGRAQTIRAIRRRFRQLDLKTHTRVKGYWDTNRSGMD